MPESNNALPHWDMSPIYPGLDSAEFKAGFDALGEAIAETASLFDTHGIMLHAEPIPIDEKTVETFEITLNQLNTVSTDANLHRAYIMGFISTNSRDTLAQTWLSKWQLQMTSFQKLMTRFTAWIGSLEDVEALIERSSVAQRARFRHPRSAHRIRAPDVTRRRSAGDGTQPHRRARLGHLLQQLQLTDFGGRDHRRRNANAADDGHSQPGLRR